MDLSLVIPVYNESESLPELHRQIHAAVDQLGVCWEIVFIDDGSTDGSRASLEQLYADDPHVVVAIQRRNLGKSHALNTGFYIARGATIITLDADLQDDPAEIPNLIASIEEGYDLVSGWKKNRLDPASKRIPSKIANGVTRWLTGVQLHDMNCGLKAYRAECAKSLRLYGDMHRYIPIIAHFDGFRITEIPVHHRERRYGVSKYGVGRLFSSGFDLLTVLFLNRFGYRPLHLFGITGAVVGLSGFVISLYLAIQWFGGMALSNRPLLILGILLILAGIQFMTTGLLAEMIVAQGQRRESPALNARRILQRPIAEPDRT